jgi:hypothetical protein
MCHVNLDLSPANIHREKEILISAYRTTGELPKDKFWKEIYNNFYLKDIQQTSNDHRFRHYHSWVDSIFIRYDRHILESPSTIENKYIEYTINNNPSCEIPGVDEPPTFLLLGLAMLFIMCVLIKQSGFRRARGV